MFSIQYIADRPLIYFSGWLYLCLLPSYQELPEARHEMQQYYPHLDSYQGDLSISFCVAHTLLCTTTRRDPGVHTLAYDKAGLGAFIQYRIVQSVSVLRFRRVARDHVDKDLADVQ